MVDAWQNLITDIAVALAIGFVARRVWSQLIALRKNASDEAIGDEASACSGCTACGAGRTSSGRQLISIQLAAPRRRPHSQRDNPPRSDD
jgi:hypothetical protein